MASSSDREIPSHLQPRAEGLAYDLDRALSSVLGLTASVPADAFTAATLGTERAGNGVLIREDGIVLTIGYLVTEAESIWLSFADGRVLRGHVLAFDQESGLGLVQALGRVQVPALPLGRSAAVKVGERVVVAGAGGRQRSILARVTAKQEFAGYWEYLLEEAIFTAPPHPNWGGAALMGSDGSLLGIGSLHLQQTREGGPPEHLNMIVPIDLLKPVLDDLLTLGRPDRPPRPWLGLYAAEVDGKVVVAGLAPSGPARGGDLQAGDVILAVDDEPVAGLAAFFRRIWSRGSAGVEIPLALYRGGRTIERRLVSTDRASLLKAPSLH